MGRLDLPTVTYFGNRYVWFANGIVHRHLVGVVDVWGQGPTTGACGIPLCCAKSCVCVSKPPPKTLEGGWIQDLHSSRVVYHWQTTQHMPMILL